MSSDIAQRVQELEPPLRPVGGRFRQLFEWVGSIRQPKFDQSACQIQTTRSATSTIPSTAWSC